MVKNKNSPAAMDTPAVTDPNEALARAQAAATRLKPKNEALFWAITAQSLLLSEIREMLREALASRERGVPEQASRGDEAAGSSTTASRTSGRRTTSSKSPRNTGAPKQSSTSSSRTRTKSSGQRSQAGGDS